MYYKHAPRLLQHTLSLYTDASNGNAMHFNKQSSSHCL